MGLFNSAERKKAKEEEKERKRKEYERIMASNPKISNNPKTKTPIQDNVVHCPKCGSTSLTSNKKGFSVVKGTLGLAVSPLAGAVAGSIGKDKVIITCLNCGHKWKPGKK